MAKVFNSWKLVAVVFALVAGGIAVAAWHGRELQRPSEGRLKAEAGPMIAAIKSFREEYGRYPATLAEAGVTPPPAACGPWRYDAGDGRGFSLSVGTPERDRFVMTYYSSSGWDLVEWDD